MADQASTVAQASGDRQSEDQLWDLAGVANYLQLTTRTVEKHIDESGLPYVRIGGVRRFIPDQVREWVRRQAA